MKLAWFRFYEELNDFLPARNRKISIPYSFIGNPAVKDAIEALGIPHVEVDLILVNSQSVDFTYRLQNADYVSVYPAFENIDITPVIRLRNKPLRNVKFITDVHLGKLTKYLRLCGFDTFSQPDCNDTDITRISLNDKRSILTRDKELLKNKKITHGYWVRSQAPSEQIKEVLIRFDLKNLINPFTRCMECNGVLTPVTKEKISEIILPKTRQYFEDFKKCPDCHRIYWEGSHFQRMKIHIDKLILDLK